MVQHIWLLAGYAGSGKDTTAQMLQQILGNAAIGSFAGAVKDEVAKLYGIERSVLDTQEGKASLLPDRKITVRSLLIEHAEGEKERTGDSAIWAQRIQPPPTIHWILSDWRFLEELLHLRFRFPSAVIHTLRIVRPDVQPLSTYTEHALDTFQFDCTIDNSGSLLYLSQQLFDIYIQLNAISKSTECRQE
jgi:hypothetical protein